MGYIFSKKLAMEHYLGTDYGGSRNVDDDRALIILFIYKSAF